MACAQASTTLSLLKRDLRKHATASRERLSRLVNIRSADAEELRELLTGNIVKLLVTGYGPYVDSDGSPLTQRGYRPLEISGFVPIGSEFDCLFLLEQVGRLRHRCSVPVLLSKHQPLVFSPWTPGTSLVPGKFGIPVPEAAVDRQDTLPKTFLSFSRAVSQATGDCSRRPEDKRANSTSDNSEAFIAHSCAAARQPGESHNSLTETRSRDSLAPLKASQAASQFETGGFGAAVKNSRLPHRVEKSGEANGASEETDVRAEVTRSPPSFVTPDLLLVPLLLFDRRGARLGYGGGYYDKTLALLRKGRASERSEKLQDGQLVNSEAEHEQGGKGGNGVPVQGTYPVIACGVAYSGQEVPCVPTTATDELLDCILTEKELIFVPGGSLSSSVS